MNARYGNNACCIAGALSALTITPRNVIIEKGDDVYMECATNAADGSIIWRYDGARVTRSTCEVIDRVANRFNTSRSTTNDCNLIGHANSIRGNQGPYLCSEGSGEEAEAIAVLIGKQLCHCHTRHSPIK